MSVSLWSRNSQAGKDKPSAPPTIRSCMLATCWLSKAGEHRKQIPAGISVNPWSLSQFHWLPWYLVPKSHTSSSQVNEPTNSKRRFLNVSDTFSRARPGPCAVHANCRCFSDKSDPRGKLAPSLCFSDEPITHVLKLQASSQWCSGSVSAVQSLRGKPPLKARTSSCSRALLHLGCRSRCQGKGKVKL